MAQVKLNGNPIEVDFFNEAIQFGLTDDIQRFSMALNEQYLTKTIEELVALVGSNKENVNISYFYNGHEINLINYKLVSLMKQFDVEAAFASMEFQKNSN